MGEMTAPSLPTILTVEQVAEWLNIGRAQVYGAIERRELLAAKFGRVLRVRQADAEAWFNRNLNAAVDGHTSDGIMHYSDPLDLFRNRMRRDQKIIRVDRIAWMIWGLPRQRAPSIFERQRGEEIPVLKLFYYTCNVFLRAGDWFALVGGEEVPLDSNIVDRLVTKGFVEESDLTTARLHERDALSHEDQGVSHYWHTTKAGRKALE